MKKIAVVITARASYARIKSVLTAIKKHPELELQVIVGASALLERFGKAIDIIEADKFDVDRTIYSIIEGENPTTMAKSVGMGVVEMATALEDLKPDIVLSVADRFETLATAVAASYMNIPVAHTQGGEVTGTIDESVRHTVTKLSHLHFTATKRATEYVIRMGEDPNNVFNTGCPSLDFLDEAVKQPLSIDLHKTGMGPEFDPGKPYLLVSQHPVTTEYGSGLGQINETLKAVEEVIKKKDMQAIWLWPNVDAGSDEISKGLRVYHEHNPTIPIRFYRNFSPEDYARLLNKAACIVGNSSSGLREAAFLGIPAVNIGTRQSYRETARNVLTVQNSVQTIRRAIVKQLQNGGYSPSYLYGNGQAGEYIAEILAISNPLPQKRIHYVFD